MGLMNWSDGVEQIRCDNNVVAKKGRFAALCVYL